MHSDAPGILPSELRHVAAALSPWIGHGVTAVRMPRHGALAIEFGKMGDLWIEHQPVPRFHPISSVPRNPARPFSFQSLLRARLSGPLLDIRVVDDDRVVDLIFPTGRLHARLFRRGGGIWWVEDGVVIGGIDGPAPPELPPLLPRRGPSPPPRFSVQAPSDTGRLAEAWFTSLADGHETGELRAACHAALDRALKKERRLAENLEQDLAGVLRADELRRRADALAAVLHVVPRGTRTVIAPDLENPDRSHTIHIEPTRSASEHLGALYDKAGRLDRASEPLIRRIEACEVRVATFSARRAQIDEMSPSALRALARSLGLRSETARTRDRPRVGWVTWIGPRGEAVLIGRDREGNQALVFRHARGRDTWLHLRDRPSPHVVVPGNAGPPPEHVLAAAVQLLLRAARADRSVDHAIQVARVADLRPDPGGEPGRVLVREERVMYAKPAPDSISDWRRADSA